MRTSREELDALLSLVHSEEWNVFLDLKEKHNRFLQKQVNDLLAKGDYRAADRAQAKLEESQRDTTLLTKRIDTLRKGTPNEEGFNE